MSIKRMSAVWDNATHKGTALLLLLALADHADDSGYCWPGGESLSHKTRSVPETVYRLVKQLEKTGDICVKRSRRYGNHYLVVTGMAPDDIKRGLSEKFEYDDQTITDILSHIKKSRDKYPPLSEVTNDQLSSDQAVSSQLTEESEESSLEPSNEPSNNDHHQKEVSSLPVTEELLEQEQYTPPPPADPPATPKGTSRAARPAADTAPDRDDPLYVWLMGTVWGIGAGETERLKSQRRYIDVAYQALCAMPDKPEPAEMDAVWDWWPTAHDARYSFPRKADKVANAVIAYRQTNAAKEKRDAAAEDADKNWDGKGLAPSAYHRSNEAKPRPVADVARTFQQALVKMNRETILHSAQSWTCVLEDGTVGAFPWQRYLPEGEGAA